MNNFFIITNGLKDKDFEFTKKVLKFIKKSGKKCIGVFNSKPNSTDEDFAKAKASGMEKADCILVLGGDGTILRAARKFYDLKIPFLGINLGHLGYLTEGNEDSVKKILKRVFADDFVIEDRMLLNGKIKRKNESSKEIAVLNDITLSRNNVLRLIKFNLIVNGQTVCNYTADGIIVSTPTGSTAYNLSLGGPIVEPTARLILVTPIAPHSLNNRSLVLSDGDKVEIEIVGDNSKGLEYVSYFDGDEAFSLLAGDKIQISSNKTSASFIRLSKQSFLETLKAKMS